MEDTFMIFSKFARKGVYHQQFPVVIYYLVNCYQPCLPRNLYIQNEKINKNEKINEIERTRVRSPPGATSLKKSLHIYDLALAEIKRIL
jgi:hypothetical protein